MFQFLNHFSFFYYIFFLFFLYSMNLISVLSLKLSVCRYFGESAVKLHNVSFQDPFSISWKQNVSGDHILMLWFLLRTIKELNSNNICLEWIGTSWADMFYSRLHIYLRISISKVSHINRKCFFLIRLLKKMNMGS